MVTLMSLMIAKKMELDIEMKYDIAVGCLLHDIGIRYITIPYENINMEEQDPAHVFEYKKHTILGYSALEEETWIPEISRKMILSHHERIDGSGFPLRQKNRETACRIIQVCDAFDGMISGMECVRTNVPTACEKMKERAGICFDEEIVQMLFSMIGE